MNIKMEDVTMDDLQEQHRQYAEIIGIANLIRLAKEFGGTQIYIPKPDELIKLAKYKKISEEFDGYNIKQLSKKYDVSESTVYRIVREQLLSGGSKKQLEGQMTIMDYGL